MINLIAQSFNYVVGDTYFWPSMTFTTLVGIFISAVIYDGNLEQVKKGLFAIFSYVMLLITVTATRVIDEIPIAPVPYKPIAGLVTTFIVTAFYLFGMWIGVRIVKHARQEADK